MVVRCVDSERSSGVADPALAYDADGQGGDVMNYLEQSIKRRACVGKKDVNEQTGRTAFANALEQALERLGEINWDGVQAMASLVQNRAIPAEEALSLVKPYMKSSSPFVVLKALTIIDALAINCPEVHPRLAGKKWTAWILKVASSPDKRIRSALAQLCVNWVQKYRSVELGIVYQSVLQELESRKIRLPTPLDSRSPTPQFLQHLSSDEVVFHSSDSSSSSPCGVFERGIDFLQLLTPPSPPPAPKTPTVQRIKDFVSNYGEDFALTAQCIKADAKKLGEATQKCTDTLQAVKLGTTRKQDVRQEMQMTWVAAEKCHAWLQDMQSLLRQNLDADTSAHILEANQLLNETLERWQVLVSNVGDMGSADEKEQMQKLNDIGNMLWHRASPSGYSDCSDLQLRQLREENEELRREVCEAEALRKVAVAEVRAEAEKQTRSMKGKAVRRIRELMTQVKELNDAKLELQREKEIMLDELGKAREDLALGAARSDKARELKAELLRKQELLDVHLKAAAKKEEQLHSEKRHLRNRSAELEIRLEECESELETIRAEKAAQAAKARSQIEKLSNELQRLKADAEAADELKQKADEAEKTSVSLKLELGRESVLRKRAHNTIREMKGNIRVLARVRKPVVPGVVGSPETSLKIWDEYTLALRVEKKSKRSLSFKDTEFVTNHFEFDYCFGPEATQAEVYDETSQLVQSAFDGYNVCIFCYGQTGSGKTYTISGEEGEPGIIPRSIQDIFKSEGCSETTKVQAYMVELYQDSLYDLFAGNENPKLRIKTDPKTSLVTVEGAIIREVQSAADLHAAFEEGVRKRKTAATKLNIHSSRSHLIFTILLERSNEVTGTRARSKLSFVDLAGCERVAKSGTLGNRNRLNEAKSINKSLSALGDVVSALTTGESFIPYRNHKLTELMRDSLGGNSKTLMIVNASPLLVDAGEARNSLEYAMRVKQVTNETSRSFETREITRLKAILERQAAEIRSLKGR